MGLFSCFGSNRKQMKHVEFDMEATTALSDKICNDSEVTLNLDDEWWAEEEGIEFQERDKRLAKLMSEERLTPDMLETKYGESSRGMEVQFHENANVIVTRKTNSYNAVKSLQQLYSKREKKKPEDDAKSIARAYSLCCEGAVLDAMKLAKEDEKYVYENVVNEPEVISINERQRKASSKSLASNIGLNKKPSLRPVSKSSKNGGKGWYGSINKGRRQ